MGINTNQENFRASRIEDIKKFYSLMISKRNELDYEIDGLVYKVNDRILQERLGNCLDRQDGRLLTNFPLK